MAAAVQPILRKITGVQKTFSYGMEALELLRHQYSQRYVVFVLEELKKRMWQSISVSLCQLMEFLDGRGAARAIGDITCPWWLFLFFYIDLTYHCFLILQRNNKISGVKRKQNKQTQQNG